MLDVVNPIKLFSISPPTILKSVDSLRLETNPVQRMSLRSASASPVRLNGVPTPSWANACEDRKSGESRSGSRAAYRHKRDITVFLQGYGSCIGSEIRR